jgi:asparagine synthase (glutamine-hydrolysing)
VKGERYLFVFGDRPVPADIVSHVEALGHALQLQSKSLSNRGLVLTDHPLVQFDPNNPTCLIIGEIFGKSLEIQRTGLLTQSQLQEAYRSGGRSLIAGWWGNYLAFLRAHDEACFSLMRSPCARLPVYYAREDGLIYAASDIELLSIATERCPQINWDGVALHVVADQLRTPTTCIDGVVELIGGHRLSSMIDHTEDLWSPWTYVGRSIATENANRISELLRTTVDACVGTWARHAGSIVLGISGGLDSSIVAASTVAAGASLSCLTLATLDPAGDERSYARELAEYLSVDLAEYFEDVNEIDVERSAAAHLPRPVARSFAQTGDRRNLELATGTRARAFFSGAGGDNVFCYLQSATPLADRFLAEGLGAGAWQTLRDISKLTDAGICEIGRRAWKRVRMRDRAYKWPVDLSFLRPGFTSEIAVDHPWLSTPADALPGKGAHIALLLNIQNHLDGFTRERSLPVIAPLLSQPIVELCLAIPTWLWLAGGWNREPVRRAFADALPQSILRRRSKGTPDSFAIEIFEANRSRIRDLLCDGALAARDFLDRQAIEEATAGTQPVQGSAYWRLLKLADVEAWLRNRIACAV